MLSESFHHVNAGPGSSNQYFPNVHLLGIGGRQLLPAHRFLLYQERSHRSQQKAFIVTRFADLGFLIGILIYGYYAETFSFTPAASALVAAGTMIPLALGLMFVGGAGKAPCSHYTSGCPMPWKALLRSVP